ncbi:uncharacterized mitochondrial protein AtMg00810-like [Arachis duranensis]|uniref:Uncharacterized mitochondrial protein AtMg00810-like n=1 Tax=Arachis duranensis TaxID=130453 RepID=A0A9C6TJH6_ARADU|nr:uncharacterized mitochondrial protein AtMg00810-like [Arachis duranensis]
MGELSYFLGIEVTNTTTGGLVLSQTKYINDLLTRVKMDGCKPSPTPMTSNLKLTSGDGNLFEDAGLYPSIVGSLQYVTITRPELAFSVHKVCQFMQSPRESHWKTVKRILRYLQGTTSLGLHLQRCSDLSLTGYTDLDWASDIEDRKSTADYCVYMGRNLVSWSSKKQHCVSRSSTEAEYRGIATVVAELLWLTKLMCEIHITGPTPKVYCDNSGAVLLSTNPVWHSRSKHFEVDLAFVRDHVATGRIAVKHIPGDVQIAYIMTKAVSSTKFLDFRSKLRIEDVQCLRLRGDESIKTIVIALEVRTTIVLIKASLRKAIEDENHVYQSGMGVTVDKKWCGLVMVDKIQKDKGWTMKNDIVGAIIDDEAWRMKIF